MAEPYDVIIVGSGAGGGMSAYHLTKSGLKVLMLEAGRELRAAVDAYVRIATGALQRMT